MLIDTITWLRNKTFITLIYLSVFATAACFLWLVGDVVYKGFSALNFSFLLLPVADSGRSGGIGPLLVSTLLILVICLSAILPLGTATALFLSEFQSRKRGLKAFIKISLDILAGVPSIVFGLFGNLFFSQILGLGFSLLSGGLTLACMALPLFVRTAYDAFASVPSAQRMNGYALGFDETAVVFKIVLPQSLPGLAAGLILSIGRALAETAALIFTSGYVDRMPTSLFDSGRTLSVHIYDLSMNVVGGDTSAYKTAFILLTLIALINLTVGGFFKILSHTQRYSL